MRTEQLRDGHEWLRIADPRWSNPLDPSYAQTAGGRWNPPDSFPVLYLNEDIVTARLNIRAFVASWPYEPEDLRGDTGPALVGALLPSGQQVADIHSPRGVSAVGLPSTYPADIKGATIGHDVCQPIGAAVQAVGYSGVRCRSAQSPNGAGRELAWFPDPTGAVAKETTRVAYLEWYWG